MGWLPDAGSEAASVVAAHWVCSEPPRRVNTLMKRMSPAFGGDYTPRSRSQEEELIIWFLE